jgi:hypothetical protein
MAAAALAVLGACDRVKAALNPPQLDSAWQSDSALLSQAPTLLYRVVRDADGSKLIPIGTVGSGFRPLSLTERGWRALDVQYLHGGNAAVPYRNGDALAPIATSRGMWEGGALDSTRCGVLSPAALAPVPDGVHLLTSGSTPMAAPAQRIGDAELRQVVEVTNSLVAPSAGVSLSRMSSYTRTVHVGSTGVTEQPTIVIVYEDPEALPDSATRIAERPRQLIVVLDKGVYGYKPSLTLTDVNPSRISPRRRFLGFMDTNGDGKSELFLGLGAQIPRGDLVTFSYRWEGSTWIEDASFEKVWCQQ